ncbi:MAG: DUF309 domain-containing protein [Jatrophihabitans sp.]
MAADRDRDEQGRARNARPRDELGRPLPYGSPAPTPRPPVTGGTPSESLTEAQTLLDAGRPFEAHEVLEDAWKAAAEDDKQLWRGLAQLAVGMTHAARGNPVGARTLLARGAANIEPSVDRAPHGLDVLGLLDWARRYEQALAVGSPVPPPPRLRQG